MKINLPYKIKAYDVSGYVVRTHDSVSLKYAKFQARRIVKHHPSIYLVRVYDGPFVVGFGY